MPFNTMTYTGEFENGVDYGTWLDARGHDTGMEEWFAEALAQDAPATLLAAELLTEVPGF